MTRNMTSKELLNAYDSILSGKTRLRYDIDSALAEDSESGFSWVRVWCPELGETRETGHYILTYGGSGRWIERADGTYQQTEGTMQFRLPKSRAGIRRMLRNEYLELLQDRAYNPF